jgi:hypothetical protein
MADADGYLLRTSSMTKRLDAWRRGSKRSAQQSADSSERLAK